mgnify:CR=1 FL=1
MLRNHWLCVHKKEIVIVFIVCFVVFACLLAIASTKRANKRTTSQKVESTFSPLTTKQPIPTVTTTPFPTESPTKLPIITPNTSISSKIIFGIGSQAGPAMDYRLVQEAPVHMLTSWYNGTKDLEWMSVQKNDLIPRLYEHNYIVHLITWTDLPEEEIDTPHGPACGRAYPVSPQVVEDMKQLAQIYNGTGPLYVSLFTEFPSFTCIDNNWNGNENYWLTLQDNYRMIKDNFHQYAPNSKVSISWGGWLNRYDDNINQGGRSLFPYFAEVMRESDFISFQTMESDTNVNDIANMTAILYSYGRPIMLAHYKPSNSSSEVFDSDMRQLFTDEMIHQLVQKGLFAISFMDDEMINKSETSYQLVKDGIQKYGK